MSDYVEVRRRPNMRKYPTHAVFRRKSRCLPNNYMLGEELQKDQKHDVQNDERQCDK